MSIAYLGRSIGRLGLEVLSLLLVGSAAIGAPSNGFRSMPKIFTADPRRRLCPGRRDRGWARSRVGSNEQVRAQAGPDAPIVVAADVWRRRADRSHFISAKPFQRRRY